MNKKERAEAEQAIFEANKPAIWEVVRKALKRYPAGDEFKAAKVGFLIGLYCSVTANNQPSEPTETEQ